MHSEIGAAERAPSWKAAKLLESEETNLPLIPFPSQTTCHFLFSTSTAPSFTLIRM